MTVYSTSELTLRYVTVNLLLGSVYEYLAKRLGVRAADLLLTPEQEAERLEAWNGLLSAVTSPDVPPKAKAKLYAALVRVATTEGLPLPVDPEASKALYHASESPSRS